MDDARRKRARLRAWRRGFREMDLILGSFADRHIATLEEADLLRFEALLEVADPDLYAWISGTAPIPSEFDHALMNAIRANAQAPRPIAGG